MLYPILLLFPKPLYEYSIGIYIPKRLALIQTMFPIQLLKYFVSRSYKLLRKAQVNYSSYFYKYNIKNNQQFMIFLSMVIMVYGQFIIYPTINSTFQFPLDDVFEDKGFVYDILESQSPFTIQQAIVQGQTSNLTNTGINELGNIIYISQSFDNYFAALSYYSDYFLASIFQVGHGGELLFQLNYVVNAQLYKCYNLVLYRNDSVIINCIQHQTNFVTLFSFGQVNTLNITNITVLPGQVQNSEISILRNEITITYQYENYIDVYLTYFNQQFILNIQHHQVLNGTFVKILQNSQGVVFALQNDSLTIYDSNVTVIKAHQNMTYIDFEVQKFTWQSKYIIIYLLSSHQIESLYIYSNGTYLYHSQVAFKQEYTKIYVSQYNILLYGNKQLAYYEIYEGGQIHYYNYLNKNTKCQDLTYIYSAKVLYCINNKQYTAYQLGSPYLYSKNGVQEQGTLKLITTDIDGNTDFVSIKYYPLQPNDQEIYLQYENQDEKIISLQGSGEYTALDLSQFVVGSNLTYSYNQTGQQIPQPFILYTQPKGIIFYTLCSIMFSQFSKVWVQACFKDGLLNVQILSTQFFQSYTTSYERSEELQANITQIKIQPFQTFSQRLIQIILHSETKIYIYFFYEYISFRLISILDMSIQGQSIQIQDIQTLNNIIIILTQNPNRVFYTFGVDEYVGPIQIQLDYSREVLQIATNPISYFYLLVNQVGQAQVVRFWEKGQGQGYKIIQRIKYPDGYQKCIIGPISSGIFFYFYTETYSELYFLQREFIKQIDVQHNMFFTKVDTSSYQLEQNKMAYSYSNKFFYVICRDKQGNQLLNIYQGSYQAIKILRSSLKLRQEIKQLASTVYQDANYVGDSIMINIGLVYQIRLLVTHKPYLVNISKFSWKLNYQMKVTFTVNNNFTQTEVQSTILVNQSYLQLTQQPKNLLDQTYKIKNNTFSFDVQKMFNGPITNYQLLCDGCEIQSYQLPIADKLDTYKQDYQSYLLIGDKLYLQQNDGSLYSLDINSKSGIELLFLGQIKRCFPLFSEINTKNPSWICQSDYKITFYTYNPSNKQIKSSSLEFYKFIFDSTYNLGYLQIFSFMYEIDDMTFYSIIEYKIVNDKQKIILINQQRIFDDVILPQPILLDDDTQNPIIGSIMINQNRIQYMIIANLASNETQESAYPSTTINTQKKYAYGTFKSEHLKKEIITYLFKFTKQGFSIPKYQSLSLISRELILNSNLFVIQTNQTIHKIVRIIKQHQMENNQSLFTIKYSLLSKRQFCGKSEMVNPYFQQQLDLNIVNFSSISYLNNDTLIHQTSGELSIFKSTGQVTGSYKQTEEDSSISIIAMNPISQVTQTLAINNSNKKSSSGIAWYWIVLLVISSLVAAFYGYVFIRQRIQKKNVPIIQQNTYLEMR